MQRTQQAGCFMRRRSPASASRHGSLLVQSASGSAFGSRHVCARSCSPPVWRRPTFARGAVASTSWLFKLPAAGLPLREPACSACARPVGAIAFLGIEARSAPPCRCEALRALLRRVGNECCLRTCTSICAQRRERDRDDPFEVNTSPEVHVAPSPNTDPWNLWMSPSSRPQTGAGGPVTSSTTRGRRPYLIQLQRRVAAMERASF